MTRKELKQLKRTELMELLIDLMKENEQLQQTLDDNAASLQEANQAAQRSKRQEKEVADRLSELDAQLQSRDRALAAKEQELAEKEQQLKQKAVQLAEHADLSTEKDSALQEKVAERGTKRGRKRSFFRRLNAN